MIALSLKKRFKSELCRKTIHLSSLWMPVLIFYYPPLIAAGVLFCLAFGDFMVEWLYHRNILGLNRRIKRRLIKSMRYKEIANGFYLSGAFYLLIAAFCTVLLYDGKIAAAALSVLILADSAAALIGRQFGAIRLGRSKTLEGSIAFFFTAAVVLAGFNPLLMLSWEHLISAAAVFALAELAAPLFKLDDNFVIPIIGGQMLYLLGG